MTFFIRIFDQKVLLLDNSKENHLVILVKLFLTWPIWLVVFLTSWVVDYWQVKSANKSFGVAIFLGQFIFSKCVPKFFT